ncbi:MAG: hypothetical protein WCV56_01610 [Candidatus Omnitrophota bacterium]
MDRKNEPLFLLVVRDLAVFHKIWREVHQLLIFQNKQKTAKKPASTVDILGVFADSSLLLPNELNIIDSFGLSGVWSLCAIDYDPGGKNKRLQQLDFLLRTLSHGCRGKLHGKNKVGQIFFPAFKEKSRGNVILKNLGAMEKKYSLPIKKFFIFNYETGVFKIENL